MKELLLHLSERLFLLLVDAAVGEDVAVDILLPVFLLNLALLFGGPKASTEEHSAAAGEGQRRQGAGARRTGSGREVGEGGQAGQRREPHPGRHVGVLKAVSKLLELIRGETLTGAGEERSRRRKIWGNRDVWRETHSSSDFSTPAFACGGRGGRLPSHSQRHTQATG